MAKIVRFNGNLVPFASSSLGTERTIFGQVTQANDITSQFTPQFLRGWGIVGPSDQPTLQDFNAVSYTHGQILAYLHQMGIAEYNALQEYHIGSACNVSGDIYISRVNSNIGNSPASSPTQWRVLNPSGLAVYNTAGVFSWTVPAGVTSAWVRVIGAGGGGGCRAVAPGPSGGGGGGIAEGFVSLVGVSSVSITVGAGGAGGVAAGNSGAAGGASAFGASMSATGGGGGLFDSSLEGVPGVGSGGTLNYGIGAGSFAIQSSVAAFHGGAGGGGSSIAALTGRGPSSPGHGGGGRVTGSGMNGATGLVEIRW